MNKITQLKLFNIKQIKYKVLYSMILHLTAHKKETQLASAFWTEPLIYIFLGFFNIVSLFIYWDEKFQICGHEFFNTLSTVFCSFGHCYVYI